MAKTHEPASVVFRYLTSVRKPVEDRVLDDLTWLQPIVSRFLLSPTSHAQPLPEASRVKILP